MLRTIRRMSLRVRLALLAAFAMVALALALFVAWRLARATETYLLRQANTSVNTAARDLSHELDLNPDGFQSPDEVEPGKPRGSRDNRPIPPHVRRIFETTSDPYERLTAFTLRRFPEVEGGFYRASDGALIGHAVAGESPAAPLSREVVETIRNLSVEASSKSAPVSTTRQFGADRFFLVAYPATKDTQLSVWTLQKLSNISGISDWPNAAALVILALSILAVSALAIVTVKDLGSGVARIEQGLDVLRVDLEHQIQAPDTAELARIASAVNELAQSLRENIAIQRQLEVELAKRERLSALGRVVAGVAHEVRNPLSAIKLKSQMAQRLSYDADRLNETFNVITTEINRLDSLVSRLLELGDQRAFIKQPVNLNQLIEDRIAFFSDLTLAHNVNVSFNNSAETVSVSGDSSRLGQVIDNIVKNALEAMSDGGKLDITLRALKSLSGAPLAQIKFEDSGPGVSDKDKDLVFEPFHTGRDDGTGLGLAIARTIMVEHEGSIRFENRAGGGASFIVELPASTSASRE